jgi:hypothetical protein
MCSSDLLALLCHPCAMAYQRPETNREWRVSSHIQLCRSWYQTEVGIPWGNWDHINNRNDWLFQCLKWEWWCNLRSLWNVELSCSSPWGTTFDLEILSKNIFVLYNLF